MPAYRPEVLVGPQAAAEVAARPADVVLNGITGSIGLAPTLAALQAGNTLALANKESLIVGGPLVKALAQPGQIVPVDSEHSALAQCLRGGRADEVRRLVITASGGPFRGMPRERLRDVTPEQALAHPTWDMGRVVTTNSATLVNKGLEVIEAHLLFDIPFERITVVVHPQSVIHSMVEFVDGSTLGPGLAAVDAHPHRARPGLARPGRRRGPGLRLGPAGDVGVLPAGRRGVPGGAPGAAGGRGRAARSRPSTTPRTRCASTPSTPGTIRFTDIVDTVAAVVDRHTDARLTENPTGSGSDLAPLDVAQVLRADRWARDEARQVLGLAKERVG